MNILNILVLTIVLETIEILLYIFVLKKYEKREITIKKVVISFVVIFVIISLLSGFFIINSNEAYVYKGLGESKIINNFGIHWYIPFITSIEKYDLRNTLIVYPNLIPNFNIPTKDNFILQTQAVVYYNINDLTEFAINNIDSENQFFNYLSSIIKEKISSSTRQDIDDRREILEYDIKEKLSKFGETKGIRVNEFKFTLLLPVATTIDANSYSESLRIRSEADKLANDLLQKSLNKYTKEQLQYLRTKLLVDKGGSIKWVVPDGSSVIVSGSESN